MKRTSVQCTGAVRILPACKKVWLRRTTVRCAAAVHILTAACKKVWLRRTLVRCTASVCVLTAVCKKVCLRRTSVRCTAVVRVRTAAGGARRASPARQVKMHIDSSGFNGVKSICTSIRADSLAQSQCAYRFKRRHARWIALLGDGALPHRLGVQTQWRLHGSRKFLWEVTSSIGSANAMPSIPMALMVFTPITSPSMLISGPPELPELIAASVYAKGNQG